jgi:DNA-binding MarR family transcriptional regulator
MERVLHAVDLLRGMDREMPAQVLATFFYIASHNNCHKQAMEEELEMSNSSGSRNTDWLSDLHRLRKPGLGLITKEIDPTNRRRQILTLTPKGEAIAKQIEEILFEGEL